MTGIKITLAAALLGSLAMAGSAQAYSISVSQTPTFSLEDLGTGDDSGNLQSSYTTPTDGQSFSYTGQSGVYSGNQNDIVASPFGSGANNYLAAEPNGTLTLNFATPQNALNLLWGSVDSYNGLTFNITTPSGTVTITGAQILAADPSLVAGSSDGYVSIYDLPTFSSVTVTSTQSAFEFVAGTPVPEPLTLSLFGAGLAGLGFIKRRQKAKVA